MRYTYYQKVKIKWHSNIQNRRKTQAEAVKINREKFDRKRFAVANFVKNTSKMMTIQRKIKNDEEIRVKTAQVCKIRSLLKSGNDSARKYIHERNLKSAIHARAYSLY